MAGAGVGRVCKDVDDCRDPAVCVVTGPLTDSQPGLASLLLNSVVCGSPLPAGRVTFQATTAVGSTGI